MSQWLEKNRTAVFLVVGLLIAGAFGAIAIRWQPAETITILPPEPPPPTPTAGPLRIYVSGAVQSAGVYTLSPGSIVQDAILMAGGPAAEADLSRVNLAAELQDGQQVHVPMVGEAMPSGTEGGAAGEAAAPAWPINVNTASLAELEALPGIGPELAQRIIDHREANGPFQTIEGLMDVSGIGEAKFAGIRDLITVGP
ncbi:MAG: hypothetical protein Kow00124_06650 [Anaerolineae bacterium]